VATVAQGHGSSFKPIRRNTEQQDPVSLGPAGQDCAFFARSDTGLNGFIGFISFTGTVGESQQGLRRGMAGHSAQLERKRQPVCRAFDDSLFAAFRGCKQTTH
jgi:hypothetical protein